MRNKMTVPEKLQSVRKMMEADGVIAYVVTTADYHNSEYTGAYFETRRFLSGFTGSAGTLIIGLKEAALFTDGRYFIQAEKELSGSGITLMKMGIEGTPAVSDYVKSLLDGKDGSIAMNFKTVTIKDGKDYEQTGAAVVDRDYGSLIWKDRPSMSKEPAFELDIRYAGEDRRAKISRIREYMSEAGAEHHILTTLDDIAWTLNIRGNDILYNPMVLAYLYIGMEDAVLYADRDKFSDELTNRLEKDGVLISDYEAFYHKVESLAESVLYDKDRTNYLVERMLPEQTVRIERTNPEILMKAVKNETETENEKRAHIKDGVAVTKFIYWLKNAVKYGFGEAGDGLQTVTETDAADYLESLRKNQEGYIEPSFGTISAYNANAAMMHYNPYEGDPVVLKPEGILLVDSGGQYLEGTTDVTRTIALGAVSDEIKRHYTAVLRGMLNLSGAKFLKGCIGMNLDILAREPLWEMGLDYRCGTGHGVGYLLGVHEPPNGFRWKKVPERDDGCVLLPGMITTNEPGVYIEGSHGIRIENELLTVSDFTNEYGEYLKFETLTYVPVEMDLVDLPQLTPKETARLKAYQQAVFTVLSPYLNEEEKKWLYHVCCEM